MTRFAAGIVLALVACDAPPPGAPDAGEGLTLFVLEPAETELSSVDGARPSVTLRAFTRTLVGGDVEVTPERWTLTHDRLGTIDEHGTFTASGRAGGEVEVIATFDEMEARATIRVRLELTLPPDAIPDGLIDGFDTLPELEDPFESASILYPLEGARMPNNVGAPEVQWYPRQRAGDVFRIELAAPSAVVRGFAYDDGRLFRSSFRVPAEAWRAIADSARGAEVSLRVDRIPMGREAIVRGAPITIELSAEGVFGTLYYWQVRLDPEASDVLRVDAASGERESVFATEPGTCVGCHALSHDGRRLAATTDARALSWATAVVDTTSAEAPPPDVFAPLNPGYHFFAFSPDDRRILASRAEGAEGSGRSRLVLLDGESGAVIDGARGLPSGDAGYPAWSPDGDWVAWMDGGDDGTRGTTLATRIAVAPVEGDDALGALRVVHEGESLSGSLEGGRTDSRPTWSPDSRFLAFAHGTSSVSSIEPGFAPPRAALYLVPREGGEPLRLDRGMGREGPVEAFWPVFSPFVTLEPDGKHLYWLAFYSRQHYGNALAGTRGTDRRQLWVMAIDPARAEAGEDPSHPPYWLPGQDVRVDNIAAIWAPNACRGRGESCGASSECCSEVCDADPGDPSQLTCRPPNVCRRGGESCEDASDCCGSLACNLGVCGYEPPI